MDVDDSVVEQEIPPYMNLRIPDDPPNILEETTFPNPFQHPRHGYLYRLGSALILTGFPGIGKTLLLSAIFYLRVAAGLPTAYMRSRDLMLVFTGVRLFVLHNPDLDSDDLATFELKVNRAARLLDKKFIHRVMTDTSPEVAIDDLVGHMLITVLPLNDEDRTQFRLASPTAYLEGKLLKQLDDNIQIARRKLYVINVGVWVQSDSA
ncbi:hypothetical protein DFH07DRAFT_973904 [Mycena maculata]|uniref:Uncharacterized protein n=1 Tax=Mycena maculata TaxID=230809 RepID=A0AAD7MGG4_9AGAR|nr:hypothetical protein DFH07DRAFT_973904 [Mycena maculata]